MGFTIDMVSGEILDETSTQDLEKLSSDDFPQDTPEYSSAERLESVVPISETHIEIKMPESVSQANVDSFLDQFN